MSEKMELSQFMAGLIRRNPGEVEFHQAVQEVAETLIPFINENPKYADAQILERLTEPDRIVTFRVCWTDDQGNIRTNRGYRVQFNNSIGPYKGGLRFHPTVNQGILKFLGFEQIFKNSLTTIPIGGAKGGSNFNPKGKSDFEIMRFCQAFMMELSRYIGPNIDVPAGDIGVGGREIGYLFGQHKKISNKFSGVITGKGIDYGGSLVRIEATGYGAVYFAENILNHLGDSLAGKKCIVSGSGNVAVHCAEKILQKKGQVYTLSDSSGYLYDPEGFNFEKLNYIKELKFQKYERLSVYLKKYKKAKFHEGKRPWEVPCDAAFPCATQNEIDEQDAKILVKNNCRLVVEGANMPTTIEASKIFLRKKVLFAPGKAANAGGVAISGLEMAQNSINLQWDAVEVESKLKEIMGKIHKTCVKHGSEDNYVNYLKGANIGGFIKVADTMISCGVI